MLHPGKRLQVTVAVGQEDRERDVAREVVDACVLIIQHEAVEIARRYCEYRSNAERRLNEILLKLLMQEKVPMHRFAAA